MDIHKKLPSSIDRVDSDDIVDSDDAVDSDDIVDNADMDWRYEIADACMLQSRSITWSDLIMSEVCNII